MAQPPSLGGNKTNTPKSKPKPRSSRDTSSSAAETLVGPHSYQAWSKENPEWKPSPHIPRDESSSAAKTVVGLQGGLKGISNNPGSRKAHSNMRSKSSSVSGKGSRSHDHSFKAWSKKNPETPIEIRNRLDIYMSSITIRPELETFGQLVGHINTTKQTEYKRIMQFRTQDRETMDIYRSGLETLCRNFVVNTQSKFIIQDYVTRQDQPGPLLIHMLDALEGCTTRQQRTTTLMGLLKEYCMAEYIAFTNEKNWIEKVRNDASDKSKTQFFGRSEARTLDDEEKLLELFKKLELTIKQPKATRRSISSGHEGNSIQEVETQVGSLAVKPPRSHVPGFTAKATGTLREHRGSGEKRKRSSEDGSAEKME